MFKVLAFVMLAALSPVSSFAQEAQVPTVRVGVADLNLRSVAGVEELDTRLQAAVRRVCSVPTGHDVRAQRDYRSCRRTAEQSADRARAVALSGSVERTELAAGAR